MSSCKRLHFAGKVWMCPFGDPLSSDAVVWFLRFHNMFHVVCLLETCLKLWGHVWPHTVPLKAFNASHCDALCTTFQALQRRSRAKQGAFHSLALQPPTHLQSCLAVCRSPRGCWQSSCYSWRRSWCWYRCRCGWLAGSIRVCLDRTGLQSFYCRLQQPVLVFSILRRYLGWLFVDCCTNFHRGMQCTLLDGPAPLVPVLLAAGVCMMTHALLIK